MATSRDLPVERRPVRKVSARMQLFASILVGALVGVPVTLLTALRFGTLVGWDAAAVVYVTQVWLRVWRMDAERTARLAVHEDPTRAVADLVLLSAAVASLVTVGVVLVSAASSSGTTEIVRIALSLVSVVLSWVVVHTIFTLRYARIYYTGPDGGVNFKQDEPPAYCDFAYLAFTVGMTFQVSDTDLQMSEMRRTVLLHALLSYLFGAGILATTINLVASLSSR